MRVIFLLCAAFALSVASADPVKEMKPEPMEEPVSVQQNKTGVEKLGELLRRKAGRMTKWQEAGITEPPYYYSGESGCPSNWQRYGSRCFIFFNSPMTWIDAEKHCWPYGANLASIHDQWEYDFIWNLIMIYNGYYGPAWIGGNDAVRSRDWLWSDGTVFDAENWAKLEPSIWNRWKKCLAVNHPEYQILNNRYCEEMLPFFCATRPPGPFSLY